MSQNGCFESCGRSGPSVASPYVVDDRLARHAPLSARDVDLDPRLRAEASGEFTVRGFASRGAPLAGASHRLYSKSAVRDLGSPSQVHRP